MWCWQKFNARDTIPGQHEAFKHARCTKTRHRSQDQDMELDGTKEMPLSFVYRRMEISRKTSILRHQKEQSHSYKTIYASSTYATVCVLKDGTM